MLVRTVNNGRGSWNGRAKRATPKAAAPKPAKMPRVPKAGGAVKMPKPPKFK